MNRKTVNVRIDGMSCGHCVKTVREALERIEGIDIRSVEIGSAVVDVDERAVKLDRLAAAIEDTGFTVRSIT
ncbi:MAG TPA: heavy-metal-associated domain-containing protein [Rhodothermales bacterium]|nr:heavy-metal-associated domain-containing protein [Rhodothermales bacterium]